MKPSNYSEPAQLIAFVLQKGAEWDPSVIAMLESAWGPIRYKGKLFPFDRTDYYEPEMGTELFRGVVSFEKCIPPETIALEKARSNGLELDGAADGDARHVNIDIGYMDLDKVVLPSYKRGPFKLYAGEVLGITGLLGAVREGRIPSDAVGVRGFQEEPLPARLAVDSRALA